jgi:hypothetical protein
MGEQLNPHLDFLLSVLYDEAGLHPPHEEDLTKSGITKGTVALQKIRSVPPHMIDLLLDFRTPKVRSALLFPFPHPAGGFIDLVRMKIFPPLTTKTGTTKYLQPRASAPRLYFCIAVLDQVRERVGPLWLVEGEKKSLAVAQLGLPAVGFCGIDGWHRKGSMDLLPDFEAIPLRDRAVNIIPDSDLATNPHVARSATRFTWALTRHGARPRVLLLPTTLETP